MSMNTIEKAVHITNSFCPRLATLDDLAEIKVFSKQPDWVLSLEFAPDGKSFAAGRYDGSLEIIPITSFGPAHVAAR